MIICVINIIIFIIINIINKFENIYIYILILKNNHKFNLKNYYYYHHHH